MCNKHYTRKYRTGSVDRPRQPTAAELFAQFTPNRPEGGCWEWTGRRQNPHEYGLFNAAGLAHYAHRYALELKLGRPLKPGFEACHSCDNPPCCKPAHLFEGTAKDNSADAIAKGRLSTGERHAATIRRATCRRGHPKGNGRCRVCYREWRRKNYARFNKKYRDPNYQPRRKIPTTPVSS